MSRLKNLNHYLEELVQHSSDIFWIRNSDYSKQLYVSPAYEKVWGLPSRQLYECPGNWINSIYPEDHERLEKDFAKRNPEVSPGQKFHQSYRIIRPDGRIRWIEDESFAIFDSKGKHIGFAGIAKDITEKVQRELSLKKAMEVNAAKEAAERAQKAQEELKKTKYQLEGAKLISGSIAHEIRTPLATIKSSIEGLDDTFSKLIAINQFARDNNLAVKTITERELTSAKKAINAINRKVDQSNVIINMLLTKLQSIHFEFSEFAICSAHQCIKNAIKEFILPDNMVDKLCFRKTKDFKFMGNSTLIMHIIMNLLKNAVFYILKAEKGEITIWLEHHKKYNEIHFKDTATGISPQVLPHIFDSFFTTESSIGTGVGLAFSKMVIQSHKGKIECLSKEGEYTEFILSFPVLDKGQAGV